MQIGSYTAILVTVSTTNGLLNASLDTIRDTLSENDLQFVKDASLYTPFNVHDVGGFYFFCVQKFSC